MALSIASPKLVLVTGVSGAGHSTALKILEDYGFAAVDNLPLALVDPLVALEVETSGRMIAIGLDARTSGFSAVAVKRLVENLRKRLGDGFSMVFIGAAHNDLMRRYNATRRQHPIQDQPDLARAINADMARMDAIEPLATVVIDSSGLAPAGLRRALLGRLGLDDPQLM
ncbi:MAG: RNase adapter RapZ, partial [Candidatus Puniceispirillum sp.]